LAKVPSGKVALVISLPFVLMAGTGMVEELVTPLELPGNPVGVITVALLTPPTGVVAGLEAGGTGGPKIGSCASADCKPVET
jgi:hypothetical protein